MEAYLFAILILTAFLTTSHSHHVALRLLNPCSSQSADGETDINVTMGTHRVASAHGLSFGTPREDPSNTMALLANMYISINEALHHLQNLRSRCTADFLSWRMCTELGESGFFTGIHHNRRQQEDLQVDYIETSKIWKYLHQFHTRRHFSGSESIYLLKNKCLEVVCHLKQLIEDAGVELPPLNDVITHQVRIRNIEGFLQEKRRLYNHYRNSFSVRNSQC